jgi:hypothetical protein
MTPKGKERLLKLADILDVADAEHRKNNEPAYDQCSVGHPCGTPACALGHWAAANPRRFIWNPRAEEEGGSVISYKPDPSAGFYEMGSREFDLTSEQSTELFDGDGCGDARTGKAAARYIRKFVKRVEREQERAVEIFRQRLEAGETDATAAEYA